MSILYSTVKETHNKHRINHMTKIEWTENGNHMEKEIPDYSVIVYNDEIMKIVKRSDGGVVTVSSKQIVQVKSE